MIDFFNPNQLATGPFNYGIEADKVKRRRAIAKLLQDQALTPDKTQFVPGGPSGFAVSNGRLAPLARILQAGLSAKIDRDADSTQGDLDKRSQDELASALSDEPWKQRARDAQVTREAEAELQREGRRGPLGSGVEAGEEVTSGAQSFPVEDRSKYIETRDLPPGPGMVRDAKPLAHALTGEVAAPVPSVTPEQALRQAKAELMQDPAAAALSVGEFNTRVQQRANEIVGPAQPKANPLAKALAPAPVGPTPQPKAPIASPQPSAVPQAQGGPLPTNVTEPAPVSPPNPRAALPMTEQAALDAEPTTTDKVKQLTRIYNSGPIGQNIANGMFQQMFAKGQQLDFKVVKDGDSERIVALDPRTGRTQTVWGGGSAGQPTRKDQLDSDKMYVDVTTKLGDAETRRATTRQAISTIDDAMAQVSKYDAQGGLISNVVGKIRIAAGDDEATKTDMLLKRVLLDNLKSAVGSAPTEGERDVLQKAIGDISSGKVPTLEALQALRRIATMKDEANASEVAGLASMRDRYTPAGMKPAATAPGAPTRLDWR